MKIKESEVSRCNQFISLFRQVCGNLSEETSESFIFFGGYDDYKLRVGRSHGYLFADGEWCDLEFLVFDGRYFDCSVKLAEQYEALTQKTVTIVKRF